MYQIIYYLSFSVAGIALTIWTAYALFKNGRAFLADAFCGNLDLANSISKLLAFSFCLISFGYLVTFGRFVQLASGFQEMLTALTVSLGPFLLLIGWSLLVHVFVLGWLRNRSRARANHGESILA